MIELICNTGKKCVYFLEDIIMYYKKPYGRDREVLHQGDTVYYCKNPKLLKYWEDKHKIENGELRECKFKTTNLIDSYFYRCKK